MKVGDYVRTKFGEIARIEKCLGEDIFYHKMEHYETDRMVTKFNNFLLYKEDIKKSSSNIIDLIEVGDYVNGHLVFDIAQAPKKAVYIEDNTNKMAHIPYVNEEIKSVITREQFKTMQYEVK